MPDPSLMDPTGHDVTLVAIVLTALWAALGFLRRLGDLWLKRLARRWGVDDRERDDD